LNDDGSIDNNFDIGVGFNNTVNSVSLCTTNRLLISGNFTEYNGESINRIVRLAIPYEVFYHDNTNTGGTPPSSVSDLITGQTVIASGPNTLERTGYTFSHWNTEEDGTGTTYNEGDTITIGSENIELFAQWSINQYTLTFNTDGGSLVSSITDDYNSPITTPANPTRDGYEFLGWSPTIPPTMPAVNQTHTALWEEIQTSRKTSTSVAGRIMNLERMGNITRANELRDKYNIDKPKTTSNKTTELSVSQIINVLIQLGIIKGDNIAKAQELVNTLDASSTNTINITNQANIYNFTRDLHLGLEGEDVKQLQQYLINKGYQLPSGATGFFGHETRSALIQFQIDKNIEPAIGYFGVTTRGFVRN